MWKWVCSRKVIMDRYNFEEVIEEKLYCPFIEKEIVIYYFVQNKTLLAN
jgi:hypothetical protein